MIFLPLYSTTKPEYTKWSRQKEPKPLNPFPSSVPHCLQHPLNEATTTPNCLIRQSSCNTFSKFCLHLNRFLLTPFSLSRQNCMQTATVRVAPGEQHDVKFICVALGLAYSRAPFHLLLRSGSLIKTLQNALRSGETSERL
jgi:hypothetical protein